ncbi:MAG: hypothetical protein ACI915_002648, partial [Gammaproteobacteria bacterium]
QSQSDDDFHDKSLDGVPQLAGHPNILRDN